MKDFNTVISIVPRLPPSFDGVGDYAFTLALRLRKDFNIQTHFIVGDPNWQGAATIDEFSVSRVQHRSFEALLTLLSEISGNTGVLGSTGSPILLHHVGYGYAQRGCPIWLVEGLQRQQYLYPQQSLVTMFHEIYASGPPWTSSFWLSPLQRNLAARLSKISHYCITSKQLYGELVSGLSHGQHQQIPCLPVLSTIGEPDTLPPDLSQRQRRLVVFGGVANRVRAYQHCHQVLDYCCKALNIQEIWDIGVPTDITPDTIGKVPLIEMGEQSPAQLSDILGNSLAGFSNYDPYFLAKSTIFAAYCAHRLLPINATGTKSIVDGILPGKHYWVPDTTKDEFSEKLDMQSIADDAYSWYGGHNLSIQAKTFADMLIH